MITFLIKLGLSAIFNSIFIHTSPKEGSREACSGLTVGILVSELISISEEEDESSTTDGSLLEKNSLSIEESFDRDRSSRIGSGICVSLSFDRGCEMFMGVASWMVGCSKMVCLEEVGDSGCCWIGSISVMISGWLVCTIC